MNDPFAAAERFIRAEARLLEQRAFATCFHHEPADGVVEALRGYQNRDGGFGHGLEPDKLCPASLPIDVEIALQTLAMVGTLDAPMVGRACDFLAATAARADAGGAVPLAFPVIEGYPRAEHFADWTYRPDVFPTAGLAGLLYQLGFAHPWRDEATRYCWWALENQPLSDDVHALMEILVFLEHVPDRVRADKHAGAVIEHLTARPMFHLDPQPSVYGLSPLHVAPVADSRWRSMFSQARLDAHLDHLLEIQQPDGGWPITWAPPSAAAALRWRGIVTLKAILTLRSYRRL
ncbi:hypothetical protein Rhe02_04050 [Rhizocola hellebori]|uniref:Prenyltransferase n=1 Tax=Rhizocola hellebori TaxID=1392758 RepID=A0A8J3VDL0_9ACTN|nr:hypothetical protein [Rhizocola hellebori]GIH02338.1 hypothetical protein Rhe02_04050 [Rhizocola hellebori]